MAERKPGGNLIAELKSLLASYERQLELFRQQKEPKLIDCVFCGGDGKRKTVDGRMFSDGSCLPIPCPVCKGAGKVRV